MIEMGGLHLSKAFPPARNPPHDQPFNHLLLAVAVAEHGVVSAQAQSSPSLSTPDPAQMKALSCAHNGAACLLTGAPQARMPLWVPPRTAPARCADPGGPGRGQFLGSRPAVNLGAPEARAEPLRCTRRCRRLVATRATAAPEAPAAPAPAVAPAPVPWYKRPAPANVQHIETVQQLVDALVGGGGRAGVLVAAAAFPAAFAAAAGGRESTGGAV